MESELKKSNNLLLSIFDQSPISMWVSDKKGNLIMQNQACRDMWGVVDENLLGKFNIFDDPIFKDEKKLLLVKKVFDQGETVKLTISYEPKIFNKLTGSKKKTRTIMEVTITPIKDLSGKTKNAIIYHNDITKHVTVEEELSDLKENYYNFIQHSGEGTSIIEFDEPISIDISLDQQIKAIYKHGYIARSNDKLAQMYGFSQGEELVGKRILDFHGSDVNPKNLEFLRSWIKSDYKILNAESEEVDKNGNKLYFSNNNIGIIENGFLIRIWGSQLNITNNKNAEKALIDSENRFRGVYESKMIGTLFWDADGVITKANDVFLDLLGYTREEIFTGKINIKDLTPPEYWDQDNIAFEELSTKGVMTPLEKEYFHKSGYRIPIILGGAALPSPTFCGVAFVLDNTKNKKKENELKLLSAVVEQSTEGIAVADLDGNLTFTNDAWCKMHGYNNPKEILGQNLSIFHNKDQIQNEFKKFNEKVKKYGAMNGEIGHITKDGIPFPTLMASTLLMNQNGNPYALVSLAKDITGLKKTEEELKRNIKDLQNSNEELEHFAHLASHDLQEPLRSIASFTQLLQTRYKDKLDKDANEFIKFAVDGAKRMQNLITDLLLFSRVGTTGKPFKETDMNIILNNVIESLSHLIKKTNTKLTNDPLPVIIGDDSQMIQLLQNLISNAIKFHSDEFPRIHISAKMKANEWIFSVKDNGIGIDSLYFEKIFVIFQRLHKVGEYEGTGIGLAVCKKIIQRHGGKIWVESKLGKGSTFYFIISKNNEITE